MVANNQPATVKLVQARWAYSELLNPVFEQFYVERGGANLRSKARAGCSFAQLIEPEIDQSARLFVEVRGDYFRPYFEGIEWLTIEHWSKERLGSLLVIPDVVPDLRGQHGRFREYADAPYPSSLSEFDAKRAAEKRLVTFQQNDPATIGRWQGQMVLIDGYHRAVHFWHRPKPESDFLVFVPR